MFAKSSLVFWYKLAALPVPKTAPVGQFFPRQAKEMLERELVRRKGLRELREKPEILERIEPSQERVKTLLTHRDLINEKPTGVPLSDGAENVPAGLGHSQR